jgi:putative peptidoglycan lipid II flippase
MTLLSRIMGFLRDMVLARLFGAGASADAFFVAFRIPNLFRRLFAEGSFSQAFVPVLAEYKKTRSHEEVQALVDATFGTLAAALFAITALGVLAAPALIYAFAPGFVDQPAKYDLAVALLRITFPYLLFISLAGFAGAVLNTYNRFAIPAFTPIFLNLALILAAVGLAPRLAEPTVALAIGVFVAGVVQLGFQLPFVARLRLLPRPRFDLAHEGVRRILRLMVPSLFGVSVAQLNLLLNTLIASFLVEGSISWLYYSDRLVEFPLGIFGIALSTVILPHLSEEHASGSPDTYSAMIDWALRAVLVVALPAMVGLMALAAPMISTLFQYGAMKLHDVEMASRSLVTYGLGLPAYIFVKVLASGFFARQDTRTPVRAGIAAMAGNMGLNLVLVVPLAHAGLALATSLAAYLNAGLLYLALRRSGAYRPRPGWGLLILRVFVACAIMGGILHLAAPPLPEWAAHGAARRALELTAWVLGGGCLYGGALLAVGLRPRHLLPPKANAAATAETA